ncbi:MAG TPA: hypothetical protein VG406_06015 [Isosphaeraceae bacterium]|jgi:hypothetical protein|nr:hypothetical protein [Isosphaeraceae bacterium]
MTMTLARKPRVIRPARSDWSLTLTINGVGYVVQPLPCRDFGAQKAFRLAKQAADGAIYDVCEHDFGAECDCPDFEFHRKGIDPAGCKHIQAVRACGLLGG